jgi:hypothetical protein
MRLFKLFIANLIVTGTFLGASNSAQAAEPDNYDVVGAEIARMASAEAVGLAPISSAAPEPAALRISQAVPGGSTFPDQVTLPSSSPVPEPGSMALVGALTGLLTRRRR